MKRTIEISTHGVYVCRRDRQLILELEGQTVGSVPLEDLGMVVTDSPQVTFTAGALEGLAEHGAVLVVCGRNHLPLGTFWPMVAHTTLAERMRAQAAASQPLQKGIWAALIRAKVGNQAIALLRSGCATDLRPLVREVRSGDVGNVEARAAQAYWPLYFASCALPEHPFRRSRDGLPPNALLNYGYGVLRASMARALAAAGLHPGLGVHHHNRYDPMPLASDVMEPFRPWVDRRVLELCRAGTLEVDRDSKRALLGVLTDSCLGPQGRGPLALAVERTASSLAQCFLDEAAGRSAPEACDDLILPSWPSPDESDDALDGA
jgi:CRISPR-associated protein Cas1